MMNQKEFKRERHFFLEQFDNRIYCVEYIADPSNDNKEGIILCKPIWGERIRTHRIFTNLARMLREEGFNIITFDYFGDGNSGGDTLDLNFHGMVNNIKAVSEYFLNQHQIESFTMIGLRIGANCAVKAEPSIKNLKRMILFEPIPNLVEDLKIGLRANLSTQMAVHKKILKSRTVLIEEIKKGIPVNMDGFLISKELWESFEQVSPLEISSNFTGPVKIISMVEKNKKGIDFSEPAGNYINGSSLAIEKEFIWTDWKYYIPNPPIFFETIRSALLSS